MWAQGRFPRNDAEGDDMEAFARAAARLGFPHVEINYVVPPEGVEQILASREVAVSSLHSPAPRVRMADGRWSDALNLASLDQEERSLAVRLAQRTIDYAARAGARYVVVHLGGIGGGSFQEEQRLRGLYERGVRRGEEVEGLRRQALLRRRQGAERHLPEARRSLAEIAGYAARRGVAVGLENRYHYHEIPSLEEMRELLMDYPPHVVGYWHDVGHAEVLDRLGLTDKRRWLEELGHRCLGCHLHDVDGLADHRAPGQGHVDWEYLARALPPLVPRVLEINQRIPEDQVASSLAFLRQRGLLAAVQAG